VSVKPGDVFRADCREWFDGAIKNDDSADDVRNAPLPGVHVLSGPFHVEGAEPGDLLIVDILEIDACDQRTRARCRARAGATPACSPSRTAAASLLTASPTRTR
jgi:acetamidase/formamidase